MKENGTHARFWSGSVAAHKREPEPYPISIQQVFSSGGLSGVVYVVGTFGEYKSLH